ncbi:MAG: flagellar FlbD family protein [Defluviitaleaceae bacterium]|nr:flagellar FlbD family protein [Defluviitaleaceae bacterium]
MIEVTRLNGVKMILNDDQFELIESLPDTTITMINGRKHIVKESVDEVIQLVKSYNKEIFLDKKNA